MSTSIVSRSTITSVSALLLIVLSASATLANMRTTFVLANYEKEKPSNSQLELGGVLIKSSMN
ncbi:hypothetical protein RvY_06526 [Ramazzottius varieornatus]|uniref:Uncharacterized protein n=1 Tax=Ramazzottius varieornatus TaxID=947166 RepID=A0A1D1UYY6_RAMVA|nr:hypothetical protein RvY_06526 [Ramazzottius varieornatus]